MPLDKAIVIGNRQKEAIKQSNVIFENILNALDGVVKDKSKLGTLAGSPKTGGKKDFTDFNANLFEKVELNQDTYEEEANSSSSEHS